MALVRYGIYARRAENEETTPDVIARKFEESGERANVKFFQGETLLLEDAKISTIGNNAIIDQKVQYIGGSGVM